MRSIIDAMAKLGIALENADNQVRAWEDDSERRRGLFRSGGGSDSERRRVGFGAAAGPDSKRRRVGFGAAAGRIQSGGGSDSERRRVGFGAAAGWSWSLRLSHVPPDAPFPSLPSPLSLTPFSPPSYFQVHASAIADLPPGVGDDGFPPAIADAIEALWQDEGVRACFRRSREYQLHDSAAYFFTAVRRISAPDFVPTDEDVLRCRVKTTGISEMSYKMDGRQYRYVCTRAARARTCTGAVRAN